MIANAAFTQNSGDIQVVETGHEAIAVRTVEIIPAGDDELKETTELVLTVMNNAIRDDMTNLLLLKLSQNMIAIKFTGCPTTFAGSRPIMAPASAALKILAQVYRWCHTARASCTCCRHANARICISETR